jgi:2,3-bisphosphoglycerate-independent phosphoglycerate mutase
MVHGKGEVFKTVEEAIRASYANGITDEFIEPCAIGNQNHSIQEGDVTMCFNFRTDRGRQITRVLTQEAFSDYGMQPIDLYYLTLTRYDKTFKNVHVLFEKDNLNNTLGEVLAKNGKKQIRIAETEKYPHVTFFFSGGREAEFEGEKRILINSPKVATYDQKPEMSAREITDAIVFELGKQECDFVVLNFANPDMVGHTGVFEAAVKACETVDQCTQQVVESGMKNKYTFIILADHGNSDCMINPDGSPNTAHTTNPVPCFLVDASEKIAIKDGKLGDIAPTICKLMGITVPNEMSGHILV